MGIAMIVSPILELEPAMRAFLGADSGATLALTEADIGTPRGVGFFFLVIFLVLLNAFFVAAEFAIVKVRSTTLDALVRRGAFGSGNARHVVSKLDAYLSATQVGITLASLGLGFVGESAVASWLRPVLHGVGIESEALLRSASLTIGFVFITCAHVILGELVPKSVAIRHSLGTTLVLAAPLRLFFIVSYPVIWTLNGLANACLRLIGVAPATETELAHSEEELRSIMAHSQKEGILSSEERKLLENVFDFGDRVVRQIMVPRVDVVYLQLEDSIEDNLEIIRQSGHTRYPVCEKGLSSIKGVLNIKDFVRHGSVESMEQLESLLRPVHFVPETQPISRLLRGLQRRRLHMAVVVDEYGEVVGLATLENVLEQLVGEIQDEFDHEEPELAPDGAGGYRVQGGLMLPKLVSRLAIDPAAVSMSESDTVAGYVAAVLDREPEVSDRVVLGDYTLEVRRKKGHRVVDLRVARRAPASLSESEGM